MIKIISLFMNIERQRRSFFTTKTTIILRFHSNTQDFVLSFVERIGRHVTNNGVLWISPEC